MDIDRKEEQKLLIGLVNGDESCFCELYASYKNRLLFFSIKYLKSAEFAEDVFQDAFASVWENRRFVNPNQPFAPYIYTIVKNRILNLLAGLDKDQKLKQIISSYAIDSTNDTENKLLESDYTALFEKAIMNLTQQQRRVFELSRKEYKTHKEIAEELNISVYTVQQHVSASLKLIREYLKKHTGPLSDILLILLCLNI